MKCTVESTVSRATAASSGGPGGGDGGGSSGGNRKNGSGRGSSIRSNLADLKMDRGETTSYATLMTASRHSAGHANSRVKQEVST